VLFPDTILSGYTPTISLLYHDAYNTIGRLVIDGGSTQLLDGLYHENDIISGYYDGNTVTFYQNGDYIASYAPGALHAVFFQIFAASTVDEYVLSNIRFYPTGKIGTTGYTGSIGYTGPTGYTGSQIYNGIHDPAGQPITASVGDYYIDLLSGKLYYYTGVTSQYFYLNNYPATSASPDYYLTYPYSPSSNVTSIKAEGDTNSILSGSVNNMVVYCFNTDYIPVSITAYVRKPLTIKLGKTIPYGTFIYLGRQVNIMGTLTPSGSLVPPYNRIFVATQSPLDLTNPGFTPGSSYRFSITDAGDSNTYVFSNDSMSGSDPYTGNPISLSVSSGSGVQGPETFNGGTIALLSSQGFASSASPSKAITSITLSSVQFSIYYAAGTDPGIKRYAIFLVQHRNSILYDSSFTTYQIITVNGAGTGNKVTVPLFLTTKNIGFTDLYDGTNKFDIAIQDVTGDRLSSAVNMQFNNSNGPTISFCHTS